MFPGYSMATSHRGRQRSWNFLRVSKVMQDVQLEWMFASQVGQG